MAEQSGKTKRVRFSYSAKRRSILGGTLELLCSCLSLEFWYLLRVEEFNGATSKTYTYIR